MKVGTQNQSERDKWVAAQLRSLPAGWRMLDAGAGEQPYRAHCGHLKYVSQDFDRYSPGAESAGLHPNEWKSGGCDLKCDITAIPEPAGSFDAVLCTEVIEHVPDPVAVLRELTRLIRPEGVLLLTAPFCSLTHFAPYHYHTGFSRYFHEWHLPKLGMTIEEMTANGNYFEYLAQEVRRVPDASRRYAGGRWRHLARLLGVPLLMVLQRLSSEGGPSSELLHFGHHIRARKGKPAP